MSMGMSMTGAARAMKSVIFGKPRAVARTDATSGSEAAMDDGRRQGRGGGQSLSVGAAHLERAYGGYGCLAPDLADAWRCLSLLIALAGVGGMIYIGSQSKFIPYVVEVDKLGQTLAVAPVDRAKGVDQRVIHAAMASFIQSARLVSPDVALQRKAIFAVYAMLSPDDPATAKMNEYMNAVRSGVPSSARRKRW